MRLPTKLSSRWWKILSRSTLMVKYNQPTLCLHDARNTGPLMRRMPNYFRFAKSLSLREIEKRFSELVIGAYKAYMKNASRTFIARFGRVLGKCWEGWKGFLEGFHVKE